MDTKALGRMLVDSFGQGWERGNPDLLLSVFTPDAVFQDGPFSQPLKGLEAIREYWAETPYYQSETKFTSGEIYVAGPWFSVEFKCVYRRRRTGELVDARGAIFCETQAERISEMRLYWQRSGGGR